jgi:hypothetical protein
MRLGLGKQRWSGGKLARLGINAREVNENSSGFIATGHDSGTAAKHYAACDYNRLSLEREPVMPAPFNVVGIDHIVLRAVNTTALERFYSRDVTAGSPTPDVTFDIGSATRDLSKLV